MTNDRTADCSGDGRGEGFVLVEVLAAIVILGLLVASLSTAVQRACDSAAGVRDEAAVLSAASREDSHGEAWEWGPLVERAVWSPGPQLSVTVGQGAGGETTVGIWADGWCLGEWSASSEAVLRLGPGVWDEIFGQELVVRMRQGDGAWGPPCRTVVPDQYGNVGVVVASIMESAEAVVGFEGAGAVSHLRYAGAVSLQSSNGGHPVADIIDDTIVLLRATTAGLGDLACGDTQQSWVMSESRRLDVYW